MVAMEESASMLCARVIRGINSIARNVMPRPARSRAASRDVSGSPKPMTIWPRCICARSAAPASGLAPGPRTCRMTSAFSNTSSRLRMRTPFAAYSASGKPARAPASASISHSAPVLFKTERALGAMATRRSPGADSDWDSHGSPLYQFRGAEEEPQFRLRRLRRIRSVNAVALDVLREPFTNGPFGRVGRISRAHHFAQPQNGIFAFQGHDDDGPFGHELHQPAEKGPLTVHGVKAPRLRFAEPHHAQPQNLEAGLLDHGEDLARLPGRHGVRLDDGKSTLHAHNLL